MSDPTYPCVICSPAYCTTCSAIDKCSICNNGYVLYTDFLCYPCSATISNCLTCSAYGKCQQCDYNNNYYVVMPN